MHLRCVDGWSDGVFEELPREAALCTEQAVRRRRRFEACQRVRRARVSSAVKSCGAPLCTALAVRGAGPLLRRPAQTDPRRRRFAPCVRCVGQVYFYEELHKQIRPGMRVPEVYGLFYDKEDNSRAEFLVVMEAFDKDWTDFDQLKRPVLLLSLLVSGIY